MSKEIDLGAVPPDVPTVSPLSALAFLAEQAEIEPGTRSKSEQLRAAFKIGVDSERDRIYREVVQPLVEALNATLDTMEFLASENGNLPDEEYSPDGSYFKGRAALAKAKSQMEGE